MLSNNKLVNSLRQGDSYTQNGAITNSTTLNSVLDLFFKAGASRKLSENDIIGMLESSYQEDKLLTLKLIFWAGDIRGGAGERRFFRIALNWLKEKDENIFEKNFRLIPSFNRWDSLFNFTDKYILDFIHTKLPEDNLLKKWMPRKKQYNNFASAFRKSFKLSPSEYRKIIVEGNNVVENKICSKNYGDINYSHVPSVAFSRYKKLFGKYDQERFSQFLEDVKAGKTKINAGAIFPHDVIKEAYENIHRIPKTTREATEAQWDALPNYLEGTEEKFLPVCDVSGSMEGLPMLISIALGIYLSERNTSSFKDAFIAFSESPSMNLLTGSVVERIKQLKNADWGMSTNFQKVFDIILETAKRDSLTQEDMPTKIICISDMEFNEADRGKSNFKAIEEKYKESGYKMPQLVFWNVDSKQVNNFPVSFNQKGVALVSGASPSVIKSVLGGNLDPVSVMLEILGQERYSVVEI